MTLELYYHPLASYCWKSLIALYENDTPFDKRFVDLADPEQAAALTQISPFRKFPALRDHAKNRAVSEATLIIEYLNRYYPGELRLVPSDPDAAFEVRARDRLFDLYVHEPMQKIVGDILRPAGAKDPFGVEHARATLAKAYDVLERQLGSQLWAAGDAFSMADCAAAPALYYANRVAPLGTAHVRVAEYLKRLHERPSFARVFAEAAPHMSSFPG